MGIGGATNENVWVFSKRAATATQMVPRRWSSLAGPQQQTTPPHRFKGPSANKKHRLQHRLQRRLQHSVERLFPRASVTIFRTC